MRACLARAGRCLTALLTCAGAVSAAVWPLRTAAAQRVDSLPAIADASRPATGSEVWAEWLQANAGSIHRGALPSLALTVARTAHGGVLNGFAVEGGWLRAARPTTTAEGVTLGLARAITAGPVTLRPGVAVLAGRAVSTADSGGYDWRGIAPPYLGQTGYQDRPRLTRGGTVGAGLQLGADVALGRGVHLTGSVRRWQFSGDVVRPNGSPLLAGVGLGFAHAEKRRADLTRRSVAASAATRTAASAADTTRVGGR